MNYRVCEHRKSKTVILRDSEGSGRLGRTRRSFGVPQDDGLRGNQGVVSTAFLKYRLSRTRRRSGIILITAIWVIIILAALALIFAHETQVEVMACGNRASADQASTIELGAEQYVVAAVDGSNGDALTVLQTPAQKIQINGASSGNSAGAGGGYFWILQTYFPSDGTVDDNEYAFGITDENSKLNLNVATDAELASLPGMTQAIADSVVLWRGGAASSTQGQGADATYYAPLARPYALKAAKFESVDELYLIRDVTDTILYGYDLDHNGMIDPAEQQASNGSAAFNATGDTSRGLFPLVTVWGSEPNTSASGKNRINISTVTVPAAALRTALTAKLTAARANQILERAIVLRTFRNVFDFAARTQMKSSELALVQDSLTASTAKTLPGLINVNTASSQALTAFTALGLQASDITALVNAQATAAATAASSAGSPNSASNTSSAWIMDALTPAKAAIIGGQITGRSYFYSADIVAVTRDGNAFKRVKIVVDARSSPPVIVYRKDLSYLGWPLSPDILSNLKNPAKVPTPASSSYGTGAGNGLSQAL